MKRELYYSRDGIEVVTTTDSHVKYLAQHLREADVKEIWLSHNHSPEQSLSQAKKSLLCMTIKNGSPIGIFGVNPVSLLGGKAVIFLLGSEGLWTIRKRFLRNCRKYINVLLQMYPVLVNYVHVENKMSIKWLKWLGAKFYDPAPYGKEGEMFMRFEFRRKID